MDIGYSTTLGDRGRLVVPQVLRERQHWERGTPLLFLETEHGVILTTRTQARDLLREQLRGESLVAQLLAERRTAASSEDRA
ncbi:hypothetical protein GCM10028820_06630 [Tessaracoccus terricola]